MAEFSLQALHDEIEADPQVLSYKNPDGSWKGDAVIAEILNDREGAGSGNITRRLIQPREIFDSIPFAEYNAYTQAKRDWLDTALELVGGQGVINGTDPVVWSNLLAVFPAGSDARANIVAKIQRAGSRAEILWGEGVTVSVGQVGASANL